MRNSTTRTLLLVAAAAASLTGACKLDPSGVPRDAGPDAADATPLADAGTPDASALPDATPPPLEVRSEVKTYAVPSTPANPVTGETAPPETERIRVIRYYAENALRPTQALVIALPGAQLGAGSYAFLARTLIARSEGAIELWAYERRGNTLEDRTGLDAAREAGDVTIATGYYADATEVNGRTFEGAIPTTSPSYASEWGLAQEMDNIAMLLEFVPETQRRSNVILLGFSLGAPMASQFAAWDFDGRKASDDLAGVVMLDNGGLKTGLTETEYYESGCPSTMGRRIGLDELRTNGPYLQDLGFDASLWIAIEIAAMRASGRYGDPAAEVQDGFVQDLVSIFMEKPGIRLTNRAALGVVLDDQFSPALVMRTSLGFPTGGATERYYNTLAYQELLRPAEAGPLYDWLDYDQSDPPELTSLTDTARLLEEGPTGALEWYTPIRLQLDVCAVDDLNVSDAGGDYRYDLGLRVTRNAEMDAPVLFFFAEYGEVFDMDFVEGYRNSLPPVGEGRPNAGAPRDPSLPAHESGFAFVFAPQYDHIDSVLAAPEIGQTYLYGPLLDFILANTEGVITPTLP